MKAIMIDDERLARQHLRNLLDTHTQIEIIGEAANASQARALLQKCDPDLLFVDIQMPGENGFELLESLEEAPPVIFTTAYDAFALRAFEFNTLDYLLKPIDPERMLIALAKMKQRLEPAMTQNPLQPTVLNPEDRVFLKDGRRCWFVKLEKIRLLESEGNHTRVYFDSEKPLIHRSLHHLEMRLDPNHFFRASRQHILHLKWVQRMEPLPQAGLLAHLICGRQIPLSRRQAAKFRELTSL